MLCGKLNLMVAAIACLLAAVNLGCGGGKPSTPSAPKAPAGGAATEPETPAVDTTESAGSGDVEEGWGNLSGRFVYDGAAPQQQPLNVTKDQEFCGPKMPLDESLVVNSASGGIRDVIVYLYLGSRDDPPEPHPSYADSASAQIHLDNEGCRFAPHVQLLRTSQTLVVGNKDEVGHNTKCEVFSAGNTSFNLTVPVGGEITQNFAERERLPANVACNVHPWMTGHLLIQDHPYMAASDEDGNFAINNLPAGTWTFQFWHMKSGYVDEVSLDGKSTEWRRGRVELDIKSGGNDLGEIKLQPSLFEK